MRDLFAIAKFLVHKSSTVLLCIEYFIDTINADYSIVENKIVW